MLEIIVGEKKHADKKGVGRHTVHLVVPPWDLS